MPYLHYLVRVKFDVLLLTCNTLLVKDRKKLNTVSCIYLNVFEQTLGDREGCTCGRMVGGNVQGGE